MAIIGARGRSAITRHWFEDPRVEVVAVVDVNPAHLDWYVQEVNASVDTSLDYQQTVSRPDVDAVAVMSPDYVHEEQALAAIRAGKHVYLEKPMAITIKGCDRLLDAADQMGVTLMVGFNMRYMAMFQVMKRIIERGDIGEVRAVWVRHFVGRGGDYYFHDWHASRRNTTSLLLQKGSHDIDMIHWLTGHYATKVAAFGGVDYFGGSEPNDLTCPSCDKRHVCPEFNPNDRNACAFRQDVDVEDNQVLIMELEGGIKASYQQCHFTPDYHRNYTVIGTTGRLENSEPDSKIWVTHRPGYRPLANEIYDVRNEQDHGDADVRILDDFIAVIVAKASSPVNAVDARMSVAVGVKATESMRAGGQLQIVPDYHRG